MSALTVVHFGHGDQLRTGISLERVMELWLVAKRAKQFFRLSAEGIIYYVNPIQVALMWSEPIDGKAGP
jgi:hypothetical protein